MEFSPAQITGYFRGMGFDAQELDGGASFQVKLPPYRVDILHPMDLIEDIAISHGYMNFEGCRPESMSYGKKLHPRLELLRNYMAGIGFSEVMTLMLSSEEEQYALMHLNEAEDSTCIKIKNPITKDHTTLRNWLAPGLLAILRNNRHRDLPQRIFGLDYVFDGSCPLLKLEALEMSSSSSFSDIMAYMRSLVKAMGEPFLKGFETVFEPASHPSFIPGRAASMILVEKEGGKKHEFALFGELHPEVIRNFSLENPVGYLGMNVHFLAELGLLD